MRDLRAKNRSKAKCEKSSSDYTAKFALYIKKLLFLRFLSVMSILKAENESEKEQKFKLK